MGSAFDTHCPVLQTAELVSDLNYIFQLRI